MLTIVNPIGSPIGGNTILGNAQSAAALGAGTVVGSLVGRSALAAISNQVGAMTGMGWVASLARLALSGGAAMGLSYILRGNEDTYVGNLRTGLQAGLMATGVMGAIDGVTGGKASSAVNSVEDKLNSILPSSGYSPSDFNGQQAGLLTRSGAQYIGLARTGAAYGPAANGPLRVSAYRDDDQYYGY